MEVDIMRRMMAVLIIALIAVMPLAVSAEEYVLHAGAAKAAGNSNAAESAEISADKVESSAKSPEDQKSVVDGAEAKVDEIIESESKKLLARCDMMPNPKRCREVVKKKIERLKRIKKQNRSLVKRAIKSSIKRAEKWAKLRSDKRFAKFKKINRFKARKIAAAKLSKVRADYLKAKDRYVNLRRELKEHRNKIKEARRILAECKDVDTPECKDKLAKLREDAKAYVLKSADAIIAHLERLKLRVEENEYLTDDEAQEMLDKLNEKIAEIEEAKKKIETAESREEIIEAAREINAVWKKAKIYSVESLVREANARIGGIIVKSELLELRLDKVLERMEENGKDISEVRSMIDEFNTYIEKAKENFEKAQEKFEAARKEADEKRRLEILQEGHGFVLEARKHLLEANAKVREISWELKKQNAQKELSEVTLEDVEVEVESESKAGETQ